jgi:hypothetical protein
VSFGAVPRQTLKFSQSFGEPSSCHPQGLRLGKVFGSAYIAVVLGSVCEVKRNAGHYPEGRTARFTETSADPQRLTRAVPNTRPHVKLCYLNIRPILEQ